MVHKTKRELATPKFVFFKYHGNSVLINILDQLEQMKYIFLGMLALCINTKFFNNATSL
jgi:hypothetical protein